MLTLIAVYLFGVISTFAVEINHLHTEGALNRNNLGSPTISALIWPVGVVLAALNLVAMFYGK